MRKINTIKNKKSDIKLIGNEIKCLSFFSGALGLDIGLKKAGCTILLTSEIDDACRMTISANCPDVGLIDDCRNFDKDTILSMAGIDHTSDVDVMIGGPPCQAFSTAGKRRGLEDSRGNVFLKYIQLILDIRPKFAVIENVRGILSAPLEHIPLKDRTNINMKNKNLRGSALHYILSLLRNGGYGVSFNLYNAANFGSPQIRERVIFICSRDGEKLPYLTPTHSENGEYRLKPWRTLRSAIADLDESSQEYIKFPEKRLKWYRLLKSGQNWKSLPVEMQKEALGKSFEAQGGKTGFLRRLAWDRPSPTLVTSPTMPATDLCHPQMDRPLSIQEYKRIQEFPDDWKVCGSLVDQYRQIGNAVPISLGQAIGKLLVAKINGTPIKEIKDYKYSRYLNTNDKTWKPDSEQKKLSLI